MSELESLIAVDVGNSRVKLGRFERSVECEQKAGDGLLPIAGSALPEPVSMLSWEHAGSCQNGSQLSDWLSQHPAKRACVASVHRGAGEQIQALLTAAGVAEVCEIKAASIPIETNLEHRDRVGVDRLLGAVAASRLRRDDSPVIIVDLGTAITIDLVTADGVFQGGVIMPGVRMAALALHQQTDALPDIGLGSLEVSPDAVGKSTESAVEAGLFWGAVGAVREVIARQRDRLTEPPQVFLTGGAAPSVARLLGGPDCTVRYVPHLILAGIAITAQQSP